MARDIFAPDNTYVGSVGDSVQAFVVNISGNPFSPVYKLVDGNGNDILAPADEVKLLEDKIARDQAYLAGVKATIAAGSVPTVEAPAPIDYSGPDAPPTDWPGKLKWLKAAGVTVPPGSKTPDVDALVSGVLKSRQTTAS